MNIYIYIYLERERGHAAGARPPDESQPRQPRRGTGASKLHTDYAACVTAVYPIMGQTRQPGFGHGFPVKFLQVVPSSLGSGPRGQHSPQTNFPVKPRILTPYP